ncbi:Rsd/AlgQ family anti-sigma factor [Aeromonas diversa]|uniref:Anti-RNA polymerase sigma 70 factor n=1 Tax=Aeromonas diversa CDC 2478-85 TaxID=1268237 RepID=N9U4T2_9GAMM|nr:Rsd/AlgQ family anti-sigma factor [Aeromonas diversa]ENY73400.1 anti-RNA polymerase sigma 70 factor [Aeromonas diversa CDC 2478-85]
MLSKLEQTRQKYAGQHRAIDAFLDARQTLLVEYIKLAGLSGQRNKSRPLPCCTAISQFCDLLVDYVSAGHFEIYDHVMHAYENAKGDQLVLAQSIYPKLRACTDFALRFNDKYAEAQEDDLLSLDEDLNRLGPVLEERFRQEDQLVNALQLLDQLTTTTQ